MNTESSYLRDAYPELLPLLDAVVPFHLPERRSVHIPESVVTIVTGQMLSNAAAAAIVRRLHQAGANCGVDELYELPEDTLKKCGLSRRKVRTVKEFGMAFRRDPGKFERWPVLRYEDLRAEVCQHWGLSDWTAEMLAIFHFGHSDVFPIADGTIKKAIGLVQAHVDPNFDPGRASPHRTALAMALWASIDCGYWRTTDPVSAPSSVRL